MRRLTELDRDDRGVATIILILAITAIMVGAGLAIDVGLHVVAVRSAQNSADATALAVAADCALGDAGPIDDYDDYYRPPSQTIPSPWPPCDDVRNTATVTVRQPVDNVFLAHRDPKERSAIAKWGGFGTVTTSAPITIADCEFLRAVPDWNVPTPDIYLYLDHPSPEGCSPSSPAGGFGQLENDDCKVPPVSVESFVDGWPGVPFNDRKMTPCITNSTGGLPNNILIPIYDTEQCAVDDCMGKGPYKVRGFAVFTVTGYKFVGRFDGGDMEGLSCPPTGAPGVDRCLHGNFVRFLWPDPGTPCVDCDDIDFGAYKVYLSE